MAEESTEGVCLQEIAYLEKGTILKIFTLNHGLVSCFRKRGLPNCGPFCHGEWVIRPGRGDLFHLVDVTLHDLFLPLRSSYALLMSAGKIARNLLRSQFPGKSAPALYKLLLRYFQKMEDLSQHLPSLTGSFQIKLLVHEGLFSAEMRPAELFTVEEWEQVIMLGAVSTFSQMSSFCLSRELEEKIDRFFQNRCQQDRTERDSNP
ncbi:MAG: recombination protein O N-terminal domain-containing protein [Verrucomicrobiota bacterium]|nr:recombination protein O N-terminal domain-containing protein [Verrucomicrobiota bacterium]